MIRRALTEVLHPCESMLPLSWSPPSP
jgi:hypothetical protein